MSTCWFGLNGARFEPVSVTTACSADMPGPPAGPCANAGAGTAIGRGARDGIKPMISCCGAAEGVGATPGCSSSPG
jgi:hypothetical protein